MSQVPAALTYRRLSCLVKAARGQTLQDKKGRQSQVNTHNGVGSWHITLTLHLLAHKIARLDVPVRREGQDDDSEKSATAKRRNHQNETKLLEDYVRVCGGRLTDTRDEPSGNL